MINRKYFISYVQYHDDGNGSFSFGRAVGTHRSWLPNPEKVLEEMVTGSEINMSQCKGAGSTLQIIAFNRI